MTEYFNLGVSGRLYILILYLGLIIVSAMVYSWVQDLVQLLEGVHIVLQNDRTWTNLQYSTVQYSEYSA